MSNTNRYIGLGLALGLLGLLVGCSGQPVEPAAVSEDQNLDASDLDSAAMAENKTDAETSAPPARPSAPARTAAAPARAAAPPPATVDALPADTPWRSADSAAPPAAVSDPAPVPVRRTAVIPAGTTLPVILIDALASNVNKAGDVFSASLASPLTVNGETVFERGTKVEGRVQAVEESGRVRGRAAIELVLTSILDGGRPIAISTETFSETADSNTTRDVAIGAAGGTVGAVIGGLTGGRRGAVIGGAAGAAGSVLATRGENVSYPSETPLSFTLSRGLEVDLR